jgi:hypothetical protein
MMLCVGKPGYRRRPDLGQFDFEPESGRMRLLSLHPGVTLSRVQAKTGFELLIPDQIPTTELPAAMREDIDPLGVRVLETLSSARRDKLREILEQEGQGYGASRAA